MSTPKPVDVACIGVADHWGWAICMTVARGPSLVDRRRVELVDGVLPKFPHHCEGQLLPVDEAVALIQRVTHSAHACATACLEALATDVTMEIAAIALRACPALPATVPERLANYRAQNMADSVMYRQALAHAAEARGWAVYWYDARRIFADAARALGVGTIDDLLDKTRAVAGPPWQKDHKMAMAAGIAAHMAHAHAVNLTEKFPRNLI